MPEREALEELSRFLDETLILSIVFGAKKKDDYSLFRASLTNELAERIRDEAIEWLRALVDSELIPYDVGYRSAGAEVIFAEVDAVDGARALVDALMPMTAVNLFSGEPEFLNSVNITAVGLTDSHGRQATLLRHATRSFLLNRSGKKMRLRFNGGTFDELREEIVQLDTSYDCVHWGNYIFVASKDKYERIFDYDHIKVHHTKCTLNQIAQGLPLADPELFVTTLSNDRRYQTKVASVLQRGLFRDVPVAALEKLAVERGIPVKFVTNGSGQRALEFDPSPAGRRALLSLLDDDHVRSELTERKYEATSKLEWK